MPPPAELAQPRTLQFQRVQPLGALRLLDLDLDVNGRSAALVSTDVSATAVELWTDDGAGWTSTFTFTSALPQCVALEPGGSRIFLGHAGGFRIVTPGQPVPPTTRFVMPSPYPGLSIVYPDPARECRWAAGLRSVLLAQTADDERNATLIQIVPDATGSLRNWAEVEATLRTEPDTVRLKRASSFHGMTVDAASAGGPETVTLGIRSRFSTSPQDLVATGRPGDALWAARAADFSTRGLPRVVEHAARGTATLYRDDVRGQWAATVSGPEGTVGEGLLTSVGTSGIISVMDIAADGHLWAGGVRGLWRSTVPLR